DMRRRAVALQQRRGAHMIDMCVGIKPGVDLGEASGEPKVFERRLQRVDGRGPARVDDRQRAAAAVYIGVDDDALGGFWVGAAQPEPPQLLVQPKAAPPAFLANFCSFLGLQISTSDLSFRAGLCEGGWAPLP